MRRVLYVLFVKFGKLTGKDETDEYILYVLFVKFGKLTGSMAGGGY